MNKFFAFSLWIGGFLGVTLLSSCISDGNTRRSRSGSSEPFISKSGLTGEKGYRLAVKDLIDVAGMRTTQGSAIYAGAAKASKDAPLLNRARLLGWTIVGKTKLTEFAVSTSGVNDNGEPFATPENPIAPDIIPGGSSCGSAVAVARDFADVAFGTDTAGSIRVPAACCGIYGLKTTFGRIPIDDPKYGVKPLSKILDTVGPMAKDVSRLVDGMDLLVKGIRAEFDTLQKVSSPKIHLVQAKLPNTNANVESAINDVLDKLEKANQITSPKVASVAFNKDWANADADGRTISRYDAMQLHANELTQMTTRANEVISGGNVPNKSDYDKAIARGKNWQSTLTTLIKTSGFVCLPVIKALPPPSVAKMSPIFWPGLEEERFFNTLNTVPVNVAGNPAIAIPIPMNGSYPVASLQIIGPPNSEAALLDLAARIESLKLFKRR